MISKDFVSSILFHLGIVLIFTVQAFFFSDEIPPYQPAMKVDLVGLPEKRDPEEKIAQNIPTPAEKTVPKEEPKTKDAEKKPDIPKDTSQEQKNALSKLKTLSALEKIKNMSDEENLKKKQEAKAAPIKGNVLSAGSALRGLDKVQFDDYIGSLDSHIKNNWALPEWMLIQNFKAEVMIKIDKSGFILEKTFLKKSGNADFDSRVFAAVDRSNPFPAPPEKFVDIVGIRGITFAFPE